MYKLFTRYAKSTRYGTSYAQLTCSAWSTSIILCNQHAITQLLIAKSYKPGFHTGFFDWEEK